MGKNINRSFVFIFQVPKKRRLLRLIFQDYNRSTSYYYLDNWNRIRKKKKKNKEKKNRLALTLIHAIKIDLRIFIESNGTNRSTKFHSFHTHTCVHNVDTMSCKRTRSFLYHVQLCQVPFTFFPL